MSNYELVSLAVNIMAALIAGFAASLAWKDSKRKRDDVSHAELAARTQLIAPTSPRSQDLASIVVDTVRRQAKQSFVAHVKFTFLILLSSLGIVIPLTLYFLPMGDPEALRDHVLQFFLLFFGPIIAVAMIGAFYKSRAEKREGEAHGRALVELLSDPNLTPCTAGQIARAFFNVPIDYGKGLMISILMFDALASRSK